MTLSDNVNIIMGQSPPGDTCNTEGIGLPLLNGPTEFGPHHPFPVQFTADVRKRATKGDILFCVRGSTTGRMNWADREYAIGRGVAAIRHKRKPEFQSFVRAVIEYGLPGLLAQATGSTFPNVSAAQLAGIWWPPLRENEQHAIANILGSLDDKIELNRKMNETFEAMARAVLKSWFIDFDPVRAKSKGRDPGLPNEIAEIFPREFEDSELGEIPKGWEVKALPEIIDINPLRSLRKGEEAPYVDMKNMPNQGHRPSAWILRPFGSGMKFLNGDTLLARITPCLENGKTAFVDFLAEGQVGWGSTEYIVLSPKPPLPEYFGYLLARDERLRNFAIGNMTGSSGRQRVPADCFSNFLIATPSAEIAEVFGKMISNLQTAIKMKDEESATLTAIRDELLPKLISGEVRVGN